MEEDRCAIRIVAMPPPILNLPLATPRPTDAQSPSVDFTALAGKYHSDAYGPLELCLVSTTFPTASSSCKVLAANVSKILPGAVNTSIPTFIGTWDSTGSSHIRLSHFSGDRFNVSVLWSVVSACKIPLARN
ncbi:hypothetical protein H0H87_001934 [Tephrocybe sp. NHM501043]|nr:hypothetical protein H0H87_001934 [Tephrocybe sp. NHM501043]